MNFNLQSLAQKCKFPFLQCRRKGVVILFRISCVHCGIVKVRRGEIVRILLRFRGGSVFVVGIFYFF